MVASRKAIAARGDDLGVFTCDRPLADFCQRAGWQILPNTVLIGGTPDAPSPREFDKLTLGGLFRSRAAVGALVLQY